MSEKTRYVVASNEDEAWARFWVKLYHTELDYAELKVEEANADDKCDPPCTYAVYTVKVEISKNE